MEIIIVIILFILIPTSLEIYARTNEKLGMYLSLWLASLLVFICTLNLVVNDVDITKRTNILEYENITYSEPVTIIETKISYPFWSVRSDNLMYKVEVK